MDKYGTLLVIDDNPSILTSVNYLLSDCFNKVITLPSPITLPSLLSTEKVDIVLLDMNFSSGPNTGNEGLYWLREIKRIDANIDVVLFTAYADIDLAVRGMKSGATDFLVKPWDNEHLMQLIKNIGEARVRTRKSTVHRQEPDTPPMYWGESKSMAELRRIVERISATDANVLITGENGTGKDMLAHEIHKMSHRAEMPFVSVDMGAISETLFESELFGHEKGAFTDAHNLKTGRFEMAEGGSLFLDEIANLPMPLQPKLLTALQKRSFFRVGGTKLHQMNVRLICATNKDISALVENGGFREDLLFRINTIHLKLPPLRERKEDIIPLAYIFLKVYANKYNRKVKIIPSETKNVLENYDWSGNIRELQHTIEKAVILSESENLNAYDLHLSEKKTEKQSANMVDVRGLSMEEMERMFLRSVLEQCNGNMSQAAVQLGISRQTLYNKIKLYGL